PGATETERNKRRHNTRFTQQTVLVSCMACSSSQLERVETQRLILLLRGTLAPFLRASESPMAIACFRLVTRPPFPAFPERSVPCFLRRIALSTLFPAALPYLAMCSSRNEL